MTKREIGILHPGNMGISIAAAAQKGGHGVHWVSEGRSKETLQRAEEFTLLDAGTLPCLCATCSILFSVCPPHAAEQVAVDVAACSFRGLYVDANAISPARAKRIGQITEAGGAAFVDGGIIGGPAWQPGSTWLHLAGRDAQDVADVFSAGPLQTNVLGEEIGRASALKMCFAAWTKGSTALLCAILAAAEQLGVGVELQQQWERSIPELAEQAQHRVQRVTAKAWRFVGEMEEIEATFEDVGLPGGFHATAADLYRRIAHLKGAEPMPTLASVLSALLLEAPGLGG